uniref:Uncharacterized protein n=1 Tax=Parascaris univalens TaxID=6257 RepID=A0A915C5A1_PARUN
AMDRVTGPVESLRRNPRCDYCLNAYQRQIISVALILTDELFRSVSNWIPILFTTRNDLLAQGGGLAAITYFISLLACNIFIEPS